PRAGSEPPAKKAKKKKAPKERSSPPSRSKPVDTGSEASASTRRHRSPSVRNRHVGTDKPSTSRGRSPHRGSTPPSAPSRHRSPSAPRLRSEPSPSLEIFRQDRSSSPDVLLLEPESPPAFDPLDMPPPWYPCHCSKSLPSNRGRNRSPSPLSVRGDLLHRHVDDLDRSLSLLEGQSEEDSEPRSVPSPEEVIGAATSVSPSEDMSSFADQITRMAKALDIKHVPSEPRTKDPLMQPLFSPDTGPVALPCLQGLQEVMFAAWQHPASAPPSGRRLEALYKIIDSDCGFLFRHPPPNSFISEVIPARTRYDVEPIVLRAEAPGRHFLSARPLPVPAVAEVEQPPRSFFPETWLWLETSVDSSGQADVPVTIPDTITEWTTGAFCTSAEAGFGLSETVSLKAFQPFFVDLTLPYSVVRGEAFVLKATAFTYLQHCIRVVISLAPSTDFAASLLGDEEDSYCLCADKRQTVSWTLTPKSLGDVNITVTARSVDSEQPCGNEVVEALSEGHTDTVIKSLLVEPEGVEKEVVLSSLVCGAGEKKATPLSLKVPENLVEGSARADFCVLGDILGSAIQNLQQLIRLPRGCGEQNMMLFAPNIYILDYLNKTEQLTEEIRSKAICYLVSGYQRQLIYKHSDGSYSTFGPHRHETGNTWLTAFVLKSFGQARRYIFIEDKLIQDAQSSLAVWQAENGCFQSSGYLVHNDIKGGVDDEVTLSTYITIALLEIPLPVSHMMVRNALSCLETAAQAKDIHVYSRALLAYAFGLAGKEEERKEMLTSLEEDAVREEDGSIHWERPGRQQEVSGFYHLRAPSAEVEMTSYVLLAYLTERPAPSQETLTKASHIVKWLSKQQNPTGGFSSTQDTVVALHALTMYGTFTYSKSGAAAEVKLLYGNDVQQQFQVDSTNRLVLQCRPVAGVPGEYSTEVAGEGCAHVQTTLKYNVHLHHEGAPFKLEVRTGPEFCERPKPNRVFFVAMNVSYIGKRPASNMAIIDVKMLSGFIPVKSSVRKLEAQNRVKRTEVSTNHVLLYLERVSNVTQSYSFTVEQEVPVQDLKPALVTVYDYYETDEFAMAEYRPPCSTGETKQKSK
ncbi:UNVERIFIED_CONTAM: Alpha-2-macroglobulin, partial [Gekko kuhli]